MNVDENCFGSITGCGASLSDSNPNSFYRPGPPPVIMLTPTVGTRVVLTSRQSDRDAFIWEDKVIDLAYMRCAEQHMLIGKVLRETDTHFVVRFEIPYCCLPPNLRGQRISHDSVDTRRQEEERVVKEERVSSNEEEYREKEKDGRAGIAMPYTPLRGDINSENSNAGVATTHFVVGIVPVLRVTPENVYIPTLLSREAQFPLSETPGSRRSGNIESGLLSSSMKIRGAEPPSLGATTQPSVYATSDHSYNVLQVSLSVVKRCCISLLHSLLEQHNMLERVNADFASRDFKMAARHVAVVIEAEWIIEENRRGECKMMADSWRSSLSWEQPLSHASDSDASRRTDDTSGEENTRFIRLMRRCKKDLLYVEPQQSVSPDQSEKERRSGGGEEEEEDGGGDGSRQSSDVELLSTEGQGVDFLEVDKLRALQVLWNANRAQQDFAPLYALLSLIHFHDTQYQQSLEDAITALGYDDTCVEAYIRVMASFMALGSEQEAQVTSSVAIRRCSVISPRFVRLSRILCVCAFYRRNLAEHCGIDVLPRTRHFNSLGMGTKHESAKPPKIQLAVQPSSTFHVQKLSYFCTGHASLFSAIPLTMRGLLTGASPPMDYFSRSLRARALTGFNHGDVVVCEEPSLHVLLLCSTNPESETTAMLSSSSSPWCEDGSCPATAWTLCRKRFCAYCGYPLVSKQMLLVDVREATSKALSERVRMNFSAREPLPCAAKCGDHYCSEVCRNRAAVEYHSMECQVIAACDEEEEEEESSPLSPVVVQKLAREAATGASSCFPSSAVEQYAQLVELFSSATAPSSRPGVRELVVIRRRHMYDGRRDCGLESSDFLYCRPRRESDVSSDDILIRAEHGRRYAKSIEICRTVIRSVRAVFKEHYAAIEKTIHDKAPNAVTAALIVLSRLVANVLSLLLPPAARKVNGFMEPDYCSRERSTSIKAIIIRYALRGFTSYGTAPSDHHDAHGLALAEEVLQQIGVPFFADTNMAQPTTVWELLCEEPREATKKNDETPPAATSMTQSIRRGFDRAVQLLSTISKIIQTSMCDEVVAFSLSVGPNAAQSLVSGSSGSATRLWTSKHSDEPKTESCNGCHCAAHHPKLCMDVGSLVVWLAEEHDKFKSHMLQNPSLWTFGRLLGFLGKRRFMEQLWDFCLSSYCVVPRCVLSVGTDEIVPEHHREGWERICREYTAPVAVMGPLTSTVSDLSAFGGDVCTRFFGSWTPHDGPRNPLFFRKGVSPAASVLSINSLTHEPDELRSCAGAHSTGGGATSKHSNLDVCTGGIFSRPGERCVVMKARRPITAGEELRYEGVFVP